MAKHQNKDVNHFIDDQDQKVESSTDLNGVNEKELVPVTDYNSELNEGDLRIAEAARVADEQRGEAMREQNNSELGDQLPPPDSNERPLPSTREEFAAELVHIVDTTLVGRDMKPAIVELIARLKPST